MAIPNYPTWSNLKTVSPYTKHSFPLPSKEGINFVHDINVGPIELNNSGGKLNSRYWVSYQKDNGDIVVRGSIDEVWSEEIVLFNEEHLVREISLTFDQLGRPLILYTINISDLKLYWYNPLLGREENIPLGQGINPKARFDLIYDPSSAVSDAMLFYVRNNEIIMRIQRDRFEIEYPTGMKGKDITILSAGMNTGNRFQVIYRHKGEIV